MTLDIVTPGHIKFLEAIRNRYKHPIIVVSLLTDKALEGYKTPVMLYKDREYIARMLNLVDEVIPQDSLNPYDNLIRTGAMAIASGDGWEESELKAIEKWIDYHKKDKEIIEKEVGEEMEERLWKPHVLNIKLEEEKKGQKLYSSSFIKQKICKNYC